LFNPDGEVAGRQKMTAFEDWLGTIECEVCSNSPNEDGEIKHGKGCYVVSEDGGGYTQAVTLKDAYNAALEEAAKIADCHNSDAPDCTCSECIVRRAIAAAIRERKSEAEPK
jgi:hypothetical protein